jgi:hypothetical protein
LAGVEISRSRVTLTLTGDETEGWAREHRWPASAMAGCPVRATFDANGLVEADVEPGRPVSCDYCGARATAHTGSYCQECGETLVAVPADEFNAITSDFLRDALPPDHPAWFATVGQFGRPVRVQGEDAFAFEVGDHGWVRCYFPGRKRFAGGGWVDPKDVEEVASRG